MKRRREIRRCGMRRIRRIRKKRGIRRCRMRRRRIESCRMKRRRRSGVIEGKEGLGKVG